ncbi:calcofluor white hypersensitive protein-like protein [Lineolata rhizophorae]|uniref:Calcofluor white hypersensitive protein-like protein n=1 Tax=Lineolata rhizophorae TaxID=578093 RepID=A0A6A6P6M5_9PEZI|nr:calcofluor white hypersensitive protein-like protein [Lineolata rhizophorae]
MAPKYKDGDVVASFSGKWISWTHTVVAYMAFLGALIVGIALHYRKIVQNEHYGYPQEWFPSVSATIGDRYPERSVFQVFIAITSGPRFALVAMWYMMTRRTTTHKNSSLPKFITGVGLFRTLTCGGWTYVTSTDDHDWHDIFMISYLVATLPWTLGCLALSPPNPQAIKYRRAFAGAFFGTLVPLIYFFIQHKVHRVPGAYTIYAFFEWSLVLLDVAFDAVTVMDFESFEVVIRDVKGVSRGTGKTHADFVLEQEKNREVAEVFNQSFSWPMALDTVAGVYNGFIFWSTLTSLGVTIWYFPLWYMGISGYEALVMSTISPFFLGIAPFRRFIIKNLRATHLITLVGLLSYLIKSPVYRLFAVSFGVFTGCLAWTATFYAERSQPHRLEARITSFSLGLLASSIAKFAFQTNNPIWPIMHGPNGGWNKLGIFLGVLAILRSTRSTASNGADLLAPGSRKGSPVAAAFGISGLLFALHSLLSDSSTMILWVWEGYPVRGPLSVPHGTYTFVAMGAGIVLGLFAPALARSWTMFGIGAVGAAVLTCFHNWFGYYGALALTVYLMAACPVIISSGIRHSPGLTFGLGFFFYNVLVLAHVWVVAYAFVPGGPLMREHTDWVMTATMLCIGAGIFSAQTSAASPANQKARVKPANPNARRQRSYYLYALLVLELLGASVAYLRFPSYNYKPHHGDSKAITAGIWTIHFSLDNDMWSSERRMRDVLAELELDVVGLLESDLQRIIMGNRDTTQYLAEELGMYVDYGPGPNKHTWGAALLSKFPIVNSTHHLLPSPVGELAPAIHATLDAYGALVDVFVFHSGQDEDPEDRRLQTEYLSRLMAASPRPAILLSYLVTKPKQGNYNTYVGAASGMRDIDPSDWDRWCEYILYKGLRRTGYARVSRDSITDTEIQVGKFVVGQPEGTDDLIDEADVPADLRFPDLFKGNGVRGHRYHVFNQPRYFA